MNLPECPAGAKLISLSKGKFAIVDELDFDFLNQWKWHLHPCGYAARTITLPKKSTLLMHRVLMNPEKKQLIDHKNLDKLDNRRINLRFATQSQNKFNRTKLKSASGLKKGVSFFKAKGFLQKPFVAVIKANGKKHWLGYFETEESAHAAYCFAAKLLHGEFARFD
jgi:hypothetical protein